MAVTTIKVTTHVRDRINHQANSQGLSASAMIEALLDEYERRQRMVSFGKALRSADQAYHDEVAAWDAASTDGGPA